jgi:hypothetical protein
VQKLEPHHRHAIIAVVRDRFFKAQESFGFKQPARPAVAQEVLSVISVATVVAKDKLK